MSNNIEELFLKMLTDQLGDQAKTWIQDLKIVERNKNIQIIAIIDSSAIPLIKRFAAELEEHQQKLAALLDVKSVNILFSAKASPKTDNQNKPKTRLPNVKNIIIVASGKGGVGKSTVAVALALNLATHGYKIALLDADIYGPSVPYMFDLDQKPEMEEQFLIPHFKHGIELMSAGFLLETGSAAIWRGPMVNKALHQMLIGTKWGSHFADNVDYLIIDTPPGTGDIHISLLEKYHIDQAIIVTTPSALSIADVRKSMNLFKITATPITAILHNMSFVESGKKRFHPFGPVNLKNFDVDVQVELPLFDSISENPSAKTIMKNLKNMIKPMEEVTEALK